MRSKIIEATGRAGHLDTVLGIADGLTVDSDIRFAAGANTISAVTHIRGTAPEPNPRAVHVEAGVVRITDLTAAGYTLISP